MPDPVEVARLLDILGNRNRRRIIDLLRQKPCFVTEISDTLMLSPKAVIEHLQMMEQEEILSCLTDDRRRKYYYLANDILVEVSLRQTTDREGAGFDVREKTNRDIRKKAHDSVQTERLMRSVAILAKMIRAHDQLADTLEQLDRDIETKITDLARNHKDILHNEHELSVIMALCHESLTSDELSHVTGSTGDALSPLLHTMEGRGIVELEEGKYQLRGIHAE